MAGHAPPTHGPPPGWYPDPENPRQQRWWNGTTWTEPPPGWYQDPREPSGLRWWTGSEWTVARSDVDQRKTSTTRKLFVVVVIALAYMAYIATALQPDPPAPALEQWLLTAEEAGAGYTETYRGTAAGSEGWSRTCPGFLGERRWLLVSKPREHGAVRVELVEGSGPDQIVLSEVLWVVERGEMDALFSRLEGDHSVCDGGSWSGYEFAVVAPPDLGDDSLAGLIWETGNRSPLEEWIVVIRHGDVLAEFTLVEKVAEDDYLRFQNGRVIDAEFHAIISAALDKLPD